MKRAPIKRPNRSGPSPAIDGPSLDDGVHAAISRALFEGRLTPGAKLPEHRLATIFDVSRERVRKALHRLVAERRLEAIPQRGTFVPCPTPEEIRTIYEAHRVFEAGVLVRLVQLLDDAMSDADFGVPPRNHFEKLRGSLAEWHSIRINDQRRLIFQWNA